EPAAVEESPRVGSGNPAPHPGCLSPLAPTLPVVSIGRGSRPLDAGRGRAGERRAHPGAAPRSSVRGRKRKRRPPASADERRTSLSKESGGGGTRTPKGLRPPHFECGALPVRTTPPKQRRRGLGSAAPLALSRQSGRLDLNQRPLRPERSALPG